MTRVHQSAVHSPGEAMETARTLPRDVAILLKAAGFDDADSGPQVPAMDVGCEPQGSTVQRHDCGRVIMTDRAIFRATLPRGEAIVHGMDLCGSCCERTVRQGGGKRQRTWLKTANCERSSLCSAWESLSRAKTLRIVTE